jgi:hypothetical protein
MKGLSRRRLYRSIEPVVQWCNSAMEPLQHCSIARYFLSWKSRDFAVHLPWYGKASLNFPSLCRGLACGLSGDPGSDIILIFLRYSSEVWVYLERAVTGS